MFKAVTDADVEEIVAKQIEKAKAGDVKASALIRRWRLCACMTPVGIEYATIERDWEPERKRSK